MSSATSWSHDFCLTCDRQTTDGAYCSQACRLADLEKAGSPSEPASPLSYSSSVSTTSYGSSSPSPQSTSGFYLSPPFNFSAYKTSPPSPSRTTPPATQGYYSQPSTTYSASQYGYTASTTTPSHDRRSKSLATSSSRASLTSINSVNGGQGISDVAMSQLRSYASAFDQTRNYRRMTYG